MSLDPQHVSLESRLGVLSNLDSRQLPRLLLPFISKEKKQQQKTQDKTKKINLQFFFQFNNIYVISF